MKIELAIEFVIWLFLVITCFCFLYAIVIVDEHSKPNN